MAETTTSGDGFNSIHTLVFSGTSAAGVNILDFPAVANGEIVYSKIIAPALATDTDFTFNILDGDDEVVATLASISDNATKVIWWTGLAGFLSTIPVDGAFTVQVDWTTNQAVAWKIVLKIRQTKSQ